MNKNIANKNKLKLKPKFSQPKKYQKNHIKLNENCVKILLCDVERVAEFARLLKPKIFDMLHEINCAILIKITTGSKK
jgi:hypothetical protein